MSVTETGIPDTQDRESTDSAQTMTAPTPDTAANVAQQVITDLPADFTTAQHAAEGVRGGGVIQRATGSLTISPDQKVLTPEQKAAFSSLGVDPNDDVARAHVRRLVHVCQLWNLDPWSNEIYLVQRGKAPNNPNQEDKRTWTIQTGIEGYRKRARTTGRWMGTAKWYWSGNDDDSNSWRESTDPITGDLVMRRVWWEAWPTRRGDPGMAKAVIQVYGEDGVLRTEEFVAHWERYAVYEDVWEGSYPNRKKKFNADGSPMQKPGKFWAPGSGHEQLAKCAEAAVLRQAFSNLYHGVYTTEEMGRADTDAARELEEAVTQQRRQAFRKAQESAADVIAETGAAGGDADEIRGAALTTAAQIADRASIIPGTVEPDEPEIVEPPRVADVFNHLAMTEEDRLRLLREEIVWIGDLLDQRLDVAIIRRAKKNLDDMTSAELLGWVGPLRDKLAIPRLRADGRTAEADSYAGFGPHFIGSVDVLTGLADPVTDVTAPVGDAVEPHPFDPREDDDARCSECAGFEDDASHGGLVAAPPD